MNALTLMKVAASAGVGMGVVWCHAASVTCLLKPTRTVGCNVVNPRAFWSPSSARQPRGEVQLHFPSLGPYGCPRWWWGQQWERGGAPVLVWVHFGGIVMQRAWSMGVLQYLVQSDLWSPGHTSVVLYVAREEVVCADVPAHGCVWCVLRGG
jgi:hypothetical protein